MAKTEGEPERRTLQRLVDLNNDLLEGTIHILHRVDEYCRANGIPLLNDREVDYYIRQTLDVIAEINGEPADVQQQTTITRLTSPVITPNEAPAAITPKTKQNRRFWHSSSE